MRRPLTHALGACVLSIGCAQSSDPPTGRDPIDTNPVRAPPAPTPPAAVPNEPSPPSQTEGPLTGDTLQYVLSEVTLGAPHPDFPELVHGFNLDGHVSDRGDPEGCGHADVVSPPPDLERGVDNQLGPIMAELESDLHFELEVARNLRDGSMIILLQVRGVDDVTEDGRVEVDVMLGNLPDGVDWPELDEDDLLLAGQTFAIDPESLDAAGEPLVTLSGRIEGGRLWAGPGDILLRIPNQATGTLTPVTLRSAELRAVITPETLMDGVIGGGVVVEDAAGAFRTGNDDLNALTRVVLDASADLSPDPNGECLAASIALRTAALTAEFR